MVERPNTFDDRHYRTLLDSRWALETIGVYAWGELATLGNPSVGASCVMQFTSKKLGLQAHGVEGVSDLIVVRFDLC